MRAVPVQAMLTPSWWNAFANLNLHLQNRPYRK